MAVATARYSDSVAEDFKKCKRPFFVGIGGAGQSGLARILHAQGYKVSGSDITPSILTLALSALGMKVYEGHDPKHLEDADWVISTDAADRETNPEIIEAKRRGIPVWRRSELLGWLTRQKRAIAVTGTHGKTTTTAMLGTILIDAGLDPMVFVGAEVEQFHGSVRIGKGDWFVAEACEAYDSIHDLTPESAILTNLEADHLDYHGTLEKLVASMERFIQALPKNGLLVYPVDDEICSGIAQKAQCRTLSFGLYHGDFQAIKITQDEEETVFTVLSPDADLGEFWLKVPGEHNIRNALAAIAMAHTLGIWPQAIKEGLRRFKSPERRLEEVGLSGDIVLIDDYAHHPTEISASISAIRHRYAGRRVVLAFQPHLYSRTQQFLHRFAETLQLADALLITDIYPAREKPIPGLTSGRIVELIEQHNSNFPVLYVPSLENLAATAAAMLEPKDVFVSMGAGDINRCIAEVSQILARKQKQAYKGTVRVLAGGYSTEREVSNLTGLRVADALSKAGFLALLSELEDFFGHPISRTKNVEDVVFIALHGSPGEDGTAQGYLELAGTPYTGSGVLASALAMNKHRCKRELAAAGLPVLSGVLLSRRDWKEKWQECPLPAVIKPNNQGSSVGLSFATTKEELERGVRIALRHDIEALVEPWVKGMEISVCVLGNEKPDVLPICEIAPQSGVYDFESKYTLGATEEIIPARLDPEMTARCQQIAKDAFETIGCRGFTRVDMMVTDEGPFILELNTIPGLTPTSIFPRAAEAVGLSFPDLCEKIIQLALEEHEIRRPRFQV